MKNDLLVGHVLAIAIKTAEGGPMHETRAAEAEKDGGLVGGVKPTPKRGLTFLASGAWKRICGELKIDIPWHTRRANVLIEAENIGNLIGKTIQFGHVIVDVLAETRPCDLMDQLQPGLKAALVPDVRAGVYGRVVSGGDFHVGDAVMMVPTLAKGGGAAHAK